MFYLYYIVLVILELLKYLLCHFSLFVVVSNILVLAFMGNLLNMGVKLKSIAKGYIVTFVAMAIWALVVSNNITHWLRLLLFIVLSGSSLLCMLLFDAVYKVIVVDEDEYGNDEEEELNEHRSN